jgi:hypothetical protein
MSVCWNALRRMWQTYLKAAGFPLTTWPIWHIVFGQQKYRHFKLDIRIATP